MDKKSESGIQNGPPRRKRQPSTTVSKNNNESASSRSQRQWKAPPTAIRSSLACIQNDLSSMSLKNESITNLEDALNPNRACANCTGSKVKQVNRFLDKINWRLIRNQQERKNMMNTLAKYIGIARVKLQGRQMEEAERQKGIDELVNKQKLLEKLLRTTMRNCNELYATTHGHSHEDGHHHQQPPSVTRDKFAHKLIKLSPATATPAAPSISRQRLRTARAHRPGPGHRTKLPPQSVINHRICRAVLNTIFKDVTSKSYRAYLFNKIICPAESRAQSLFKFCRQSKLPRTQSHESVWVMNQVNSHSGPTSTSSNRQRRPTEGESYSKRMVKASHENQDKHEPKSSSNERLTPETITEEIEATEAKADAEDDEFGDDALGSLPNSFQTFQELCRADRGFFHSVYHHVPNLECSSGELRTFTSGSSWSSQETCSASSASNCESGVGEGEETSGNTHSQVNQPYSVVTVHRNTDFDVDDLQSHDSQESCVYIAKFLETNSMDDELVDDYKGSDSDGSDGLAGTDPEPGDNYPDDDAIDGDNTEASEATELEGDGIGKLSVVEGEEKHAPGPESQPVVGNPSQVLTPPSLNRATVEEFETAVTDAQEKDTESALLSPTLDNDQEVFQESESGEENENEETEFNTDHSGRFTAVQAPNEKDDPRSDTPGQELMSSASGNLADISNSSSTEAVEKEKEVLPRNRVPVGEEPAENLKTKPRKEPEFTVLDATMELEKDPLKQKLMQRTWGGLVARFRTPPPSSRNLSNLHEEASMATLKFPTMKMDTNKKARERRRDSFIEDQLRNIGIFPESSPNEQPRRPPSSLDYDPNRAPRRYRIRTPPRPPITPVFKALTINEKGIEIVDVLGLGSKPTPSAMRHLNTKTAIIPIKRGIYQSLGPIPSTVVIAEPFRSRSRGKESRTEQSRVKFVNTKSTNTKTKPAKISTHGLVKAIGEFQIKHGLITSREQSALSSSFGGNIGRRNVVGLSTILLQSKTSSNAKARIHAIHNHSKFPHPPSQRDIQSEVRRRLVANIAKKEANAQFYKATQNSIASSVTRRIQDAFIRRLPQPFIPLTLPMPPKPPPNMHRRPPPLYPLKPSQDRRQYTLEDLKSSRIVKPVPRKELPDHLRYGNFSYRFWPSVCARLPSPAPVRPESNARHHQQYLQSKLIHLPNLNFTTAAGFRRYKIRNAYA